MTSEDYDSAEVHHIVEDALRQLEYDETKSTSTSRNVLKYGETHLLEKLQEILPEYVQHYTDTTVIINRLREKLYQPMHGDNPLPKLQQLHTAVQNCQACPRRTSDPYLPKWNLTDPDVVFITDNVLIGSQPDKLLLQCFKEAGYRSARICCTSVVRCNFPDKLQAEEIYNCTSRYLFQEIQLMQPSLIVTVGSLAGSVLLGEDIKITLKRGEPHWLGPWQVLPTLSQYHAARTTKLSDQLMDDISKSFQMVYGTHTKKAST